MNYDFSKYQFFHYTPIQIRFNDIDVLGHVNNSIYQSFFDAARFEYFNDVLHIVRFHNHEWVVLATITIDYIEPIVLRETVEVATKIISVGNKSFVMLQELIAGRGSENPRIKTRTSSVLVGYDLDTERTQPISAAWRERIAAFETDITF